MSSRTVGTCSICGGRVSVPDHWMGIYPPIPTCDSCGAHMKEPHGPVVEMEPREPKPRTSFSGEGSVAIRAWRLGAPRSWPQRWD
jgi:hypothetical protein